MSSKSSLTTPEFCLSFLFSAVVTALIYVFIPPRNDSNTVIHGIILNMSLLSTVIITLAGFLLTALSILLVLPNNEIISLIKKSPNFGVIYRFFLLTIVLLFTVFAGTIAGIIIAPTIPLYYYCLLFGLLLAFSSVSVTLIIFSRLVGVFS